MRRSDYLLAATFGSFALLAGAFFFQFLGWAPCQMCLWQRWPHAAAILIGLIAFFIPGRVLPGLGALAAGGAAGIGLYHSGVERKFWEGPQSCSGSGASLFGQSGELLLPGAGGEAELVLCDQLEPFFLGLTMANWNAVLSLGLVLVWLAALRVSRRAA